MDPQTDIYDIYQGVAPGLWTMYWPWFVAAIVGLIVILLAVHFWIQRRGQIQPIEPDVLARSCLARLEVSGAAMSASQYMAALSSILRDYLQARFDISASSMTTDELQTGLPAGSPLHTHRNSVLTLLSDLDTRRFTAAATSTADREQLKQQTLDCIEQLEAATQAEP